MPRLYADEQFPRKVSELLRTMGHDVLTVQEAGNANLGIPDEEVLAFAVSDNRAVITLNRQDFIRLHRANPVHSGIIACTNDTHRERMAIRINEAMSDDKPLRVYAAEEPLQGKLIRVVRPAS
jgi:predicted nuclease of predicted toxin-antitoxin system